MKNKSCLKSISSKIKSSRDINVVLKLLEEAKILFAKEESISRVDFCSFLLEHVIPEWCSLLPSNSVNQLVFIYFNDDNFNSLNNAMCGVANTMQSCKGFCYVCFISFNIIIIIIAYIFLFLFVFF